MNLKCLMGWHDWGERTFTRTSWSRTCKRCGKTQVRRLPVEVVVATELTRLALHEAVIGCLLFMGKQKEAEKRRKKLKAKRSLVENEVEGALSGVNENE